MACLGIRCVGDCLLRKPDVCFLDDRSFRASGFNSHRHCRAIPSPADKPSFPRMSMVATNATATMTATGVLDRPVANNPAASFFDSGVDLVPVDKSVNDDDAECDDRCNGSPIVSEKFDEWIRDSVTEIVKNIQKAPLLLKVYADGEVKTEAAVTSEDWPNVLMRDRVSSPDGVILVEELGERRDPEESGGRLEEDGTKAFGVLIQGKGRDQCKSACYLLKTSRVNGGTGGLFCTHFCLMKVKNFRKSAFSQFSDCWLLQ